MLIGYARKSTYEQNINLQKDALKNSGCEKIFTDQITGSKADRPGLTKALNMLRRGDTLVVWRLDRLGRSLKHLIEIVENLEEKKIGFKSLQESIDTTTSGGRLIFHIFGALAEFERHLIKERTYAGLNAARARGRLGGRPKKLNNKKKKLAIKLHNEQKHTVAEIGEMLGVSRMTIYRYVNEEKSNHKKVR
ncbi:MAG: recombinase family protein [Thermotogota bacterium]|nr:recombinase family protein [Thermotogota bacterium]